MYSNCCLNFFGGRQVTNVCFQRICGTLESTDYLTLSQQITSSCSEEESKCG